MIQNQVILPSFDREKTSRTDVEPIELASWFGNIAFNYLSKELYNIYIYIYIFELILLKGFFNERYLTLCKIPKFHLIFWCGNFLESHSFRSVSGESCGNCAFQQNFHTRKLGEISVFQAVLSYVEQVENMILQKMNASYVFSNILKIF